MDELILRLPLNAKQCREIEELKQQIFALQKENEELKKQVAQNIPKSGLSPESLKILQFLFKQADQYIAKEIAQLFGLDANVSKYHCEKLKALGLVSDG